MRADKPQQTDSGKPPQVIAVMIANATAKTSCIKLRPARNSKSHIRQSLLEQQWKTFLAQVMPDNMKAATRARHSKSTMGFLALKLLRKPMLYPSLDIPFNIIYYYAGNYKSIIENGI